MIHFAQGEYFVLLFAIPLFFLFFALRRRFARKRVARFGDPSILMPLIPHYSKWRGRIKIILLSTAFFFFVVGLARPQLGARIKEVEGKGAEIMIALDVSNSMLAEDYSPNRLERAKLAISRLTDRLRNDRIGLIVFAGQAFVQLPVTTDYVSAKMFLNSVGPNSVPVQGTSLSDAVRLGIKSFSSEKAESGKAIILITDGEDHEDNPIEIATSAKELGIRVYTIGIGSVEGKPIPMENGELLRDKDGNIVVTKLDEKTLAEVASAGGGAYVKAGNRDFGLDSIVEDIREMQSETYRSVVFEDFDEQYMYFFAIALFFFVLDFLVTERRRSLFFK
jgi:Ca-activated chloride channel family protein